MPVTLAPIGAKALSPLAPLASDRRLPRPRNDNTCAPTDQDRVIEAALRHFAVHGLGSARAAYAKAERARAAGDTELADDWIAICSAFDRRLGAGIRQVARAPSRSPTIAF